MQALVLNDGLSYRLDAPQPIPKHNEALIRLKLAGICSTDLELIKGYAGFSGVIGHEFVGVVEAVGTSADENWVGRCVVGTINIGCQMCDTCQSDGPDHCLQRRVLGIRGKDGVFADYFTLPVANLYPVPETMPDEAAVFTEPLAAALRVLDQLDGLNVTEVAVLGPGRLGLLIAKVLTLSGYDVMVLGRSERSLDLPQQWQLNTALTQDLADNHYACVVDASGCAAGFAQALRILKPRGNLILKSTFSAKEPLDLSKIVVAELNVLGSRCGPFDKALAVLQRKSIPVETMIDGRYALKDYQAAFEHAAQTGVRKILLHP